MSLRFRYRMVIIILVLITPTYSLFSTDIHLIYKNPVLDSKANTQIIYFANQLFALGNEALFQKLGSNDSALVRLGEYLVFSYATAFLSAFSHEWSHVRTAEYYGLNPTVKFDVFGGEVRHEFLNDVNGNIRIITAGLNQQEFNAEYTFEKIVLSKKLTYVNGMNLMVNRLGTFGYALVTLGGYDSLGNDIINYEILTEIKGYKIGRNQMFTFSLLSILASASIWQNFILAYGFISENKRSDSLIILWDTVVPPLFQYYLTEHGDLFSGILPVLKPFPTFVYFAFGIEKWMYRLGLRSYVYQGDYFEVIPYIYYNEVPHSNIEGYQVGIDFSFYFIPKKLSVTLILKYSKNDIIDELKIESGEYIGVGGGYTF